MCHCDMNKVGQNISTTCRSSSGHVRVCPLLLCLFDIYQASGPRAPENVAVTSLPSKLLDGSSEMSTAYGQQLQPRRARDTYGKGRGQDMSGR